MDDLGGIGDDRCKAPACATGRRWRFLLSNSLAAPADLRPDQLARRKLRHAPDGIAELAFKQRPAIVQQQDHHDGARCGIYSTRAVLPLGQADDVAANLQEAAFRQRGSPAFQPRCVSLSADGRSHDSVLVS